MKYRDMCGDNYWVVDSDKAAECIKAGFIYVRPTSQEERIKLIDMLEEDGYEAYEASYESSIETVYPLGICLSEKKYSHLHTTTSAAAACSQEIVISEKEFYIIYAFY